jgi:hypothetical protein
VSIRPQTPRSPTHAGPAGRARPHRRAVAGAASLLFHLTILLAFLLAPGPQPVRPPAVTQVEIVSAPAAAARLAPPGPASASQAQAAKARTPAHPTGAAGPVSRLKLRAAPDALAAGEEADAEPAAGPMSETDLAGAARAGSGGGGGGTCDMAARVQAALRADPLVRSAVASYAGNAWLVWNGEWVRNRGQDGRGLAVVREAILWAVGFAPAQCRNEPVRGLVLISLQEGSGGTRLALGQARWRWSDVLTPHAGGAG